MKHRYNDSALGSRKGRAFRPVLMALIIAAVCWGFWTNSQRRLEGLAGQGIFRDETASLTPAQKAEILDRLKAFKRDFGIALELNILQRPPALKSNETARIYLDVVPGQGRAFLYLPPLVRHAVGMEFIQEMETAFQQDFGSGDWRINLIPAILALETRLREVTR